MVLSLDIGIFAEQALISEYLQSKDLDFGLFAEQQRWQKQRRVESRVPSRAS